MRKTTRWLAVLLALTLVTAACGDDDDGDDTSTGGSAETSAPADDGYGTTDQDQNVLAVEIGVADTPYGEVLTNGDGLSLYVFDEDEGQETPGCENDCAQKWPAVITESVDDVTLPDGVDVEVGLAERASGVMQVTIDGRPVYTMNGDEPGEALCQGGNDVWWVVDTDGEKNTTPPVEDA